jgi:5'-3' exonuclease
MGVSGFFSFFQNVSRKRSLQDGKGKWIVIDASVVIHRYVIGIRRSGSDMTTEHGELTSHLYAVAFFTSVLLERGIRCIWVFDGIATNDKRDTIERRREERYTASKKCAELEELGDTESDNYVKHFKRSFGLTKNIVDECKLLLDTMGVPYVDSIDEADPQCAAIAIERSSEVFGVCTEDSDIMVYGAPCILSSPNFSDNTVTEIEWTDVLKELQTRSNTIRKSAGKDSIPFSRENFIDFMLILGTDYCQGIKGVGRDFLFGEYALADYNISVFLGRLYSYGGRVERGGTMCHIRIPDHPIKSWNHASECYKHAKTFDPRDIRLEMTPPDIKSLIGLLKSKNFDEKFISDVAEKILITYHTFKHIEYARDSRCKSAFMSFSSYQFRHFQTQVRNRLKKTRELPIKINDSLKIPTQCKVDDWEIVKYKHRSIKVC